jgi:23S rRNA pseudouridine955/2504/2580 synthase
MNEPTVKPRPRVRQVSVTADEAGQRIDNFLARYLKGVPRSHIYRILRRGEVRVNSGRIKARYKVCAGDTVRIPPVRVASTGAPRTVWVPSGGLAAHIQFENSRCLVLNKPAGMAVHGGSGVSQGVIEVLRAERPAAPYLELAHRLDRDTSGCLVIAKRRSFLRAFHEQLRAGAVEKYYLALVAGVWEGGERTVEAPLRKNTLQGGERIVRVDAGGKTALTVFRPVDRFRQATLVEAVLHTGRTHQIRVHAAHIGHPLAGDAKYGSRTFNAGMRDAGLRRMFLHAHRVVFDDSGGERVDISVPLDDGLKAVLEGLESA